MPIILTERAAEHVKQFLAGKGHKAAALRIGVHPSGCSGQSYVVEPADTAADDDYVFDSHGVKLLVDARSLNYLDGTELDYVREGLNEGFRFNNPNVKDTCGCGESFKV